MHCQKREEEKARLDAEQGPRHYAKIQFFSFSDSLPPFHQQLQEIQK